MSRLLLFSLFVYSINSIAQEGVYTFVNLELDKSELKLFTENLLDSKNDSAFYILTEIEEVNNISRIENGLAPIHLIDTIEHTRLYYIIDYNGEPTYHNDSIGTSVSHPTQWTEIDITKSDSVRALIQITGKEENLNFKILGFHLIQNENETGKIDSARTDLYYHFNFNQFTKLNLSKRIPCSFYPPDKSREDISYCKIGHFALVYEGAFSFRHFDNFNYLELLYLEKQNIQIYDHSLHYVFDFSAGENQFSIE